MLICDCVKEIPTDNETLVHDGYVERLYSDEETIPIKVIADQIPYVVCGVEVLCMKRLGELDLEEHARCVLQAAKRVMDKNTYGAPPQSMVKAASKAQIYIKGREKRKLYGIYRYVFTT